MIKKLRKILHVLIVLFFLGYYYGATTFIHTHILESGDSITHSHPYKSSSHNHTESSFNLVASFTFFVVLAAAISVAIVRDSKSFNYYICGYKNVYKVTHPHSLSRGPPQF